MGFSGPVPSISQVGRWKNGKRGREKGRGEERETGILAEVTETPFLLGTWPEDQSRKDAAVEETIPWDEQGLQPTATGRGWLSI